MFRASTAVLFLAGLAGLSPAADGATKVKEGDPFPDVPLAAAQADKAVPGKQPGDAISIADLKGKTAVVFFYPKALTPGCTVESCGFRDLADQFPKDAVLLGASGDGLKLQDKFIAEHKLPYALLCDTELKLIDALGIRSAPGGKTAKRVTFVVGPDGKVLKVYDKVAPKSHPAEVLAFVTRAK